MYIKIFGLILVSVAGIQGLPAPLGMLEMRGPSIELPSVEISSKGDPAMGTPSFEFSSAAEPSARTPSVALHHEGLHSAEGTSLKISTGTSSGAVPPAKGHSGTIICVGGDSMSGSAAEVPAGKTVHEGSSAHSTDGSSDGIPAGGKSSGFSHRIPLGHHDSYSTSKPAEMLSPPSDRLPSMDSDGYDGYDSMDYAELGHKGHPGLGYKGHSGPGPMGHFGPGPMGHPGPGPMGHPGPGSMGHPGPGPKGNHGSGC